MATTKRQTRKRAIAGATAEVAQEHLADLSGSLPDLDQWDGLSERNQMIAGLLGLQHSYAAIGRLVGVTKQAIEQSIKRYDLKQLVSSLTPSDIKRMRASHFATVSDRALLHVTDAKLEASSAAQLAVIAGIGSDKRAAIESEIAVEDTRTKIGLDFLQTVHEVPGDDGAPALPPARTGLPAPTHPTAVD